MHMAPKDNRPPPLGNRSLRRWTLITLLLIAFGGIAMCAAKLRDIDRAYAAASAVYDCKRQAAAENRDMAACDKPADAGTEAE